MSNCLLYAAKVATGIKYHECQTLVGHDGEEAVGPFRRGYHIQEIIEKIMLPNGFTMTPLEVAPVSEWKDRTKKVILEGKVYGVYGTTLGPLLNKRARSLLSYVDIGILEGVSTRGIGHAYAKVRGKLYDQNGEYTPDEVFDGGFILTCIWKIDRI